jgi:hypothetical protein
MDDVEKRKVLTLPGLELQSPCFPARHQSLSRLHAPPLLCWTSTNENEIRPTAYNMFPINIKFCRISLSNSSDWKWCVKTDFYFWVLHPVASITTIFFGFHQSQMYFSNVCLLLLLHTHYITGHLQEEYCLLPKELFFLINFNLIT